MLKGATLAKRRWRQSRGPGDNDYNARRQTSDRAPQNPDLPGVASKRKGERVGATSRFSVLWIADRAATLRDADARGYPARLRRNSANFRNPSPRSTEEVKWYCDLIVESTE